MAKSQETHSWNANDYKYALIRTKSLITVALKHLEGAKGEEIPDDSEFREILFSLAATV